MLPEKRPGLKPYRSLCNARACQHLPPGIPQRRHAGPGPCRAFVVDGMKDHLGQIGCQHSPQGWICGGHLQLLQEQVRQLLDGQQVSERGRPGCPPQMRQIRWPRVPGGHHFG